MQVKVPIGPAGRAGHRLPPGRRADLLPQGGQRKGHGFGQLPEFGRFGWSLPRSLPAGGHELGPRRYIVVQGPSPATCKRPALSRPSYRLMGRHRTRESSTDTRWTLTCGNGPGCTGRMPCTRLWIRRLGFESSERTQLTGPDRYGWGLLVGQIVTTRDYLPAGCIEYLCRYNQFIWLRAAGPQRTRASRNIWRAPGRRLTTDLRAPRTRARCTRWTWGEAGADDAGRLRSPRSSASLVAGGASSGALLTHRQRQPQEKGAILR